MAVAPGLQVGRLQPSVGGGLGDAGVLGQGADAPRGGSGWWLQWGVGRLGHPLAMMGGARALFALQPCPALVEEATAPVAHRLAQPHPWPLQVASPSPQARALGEREGAGHGLHLLSFSSSGRRRGNGGRPMAMGQLLPWMAYSFLSLTPVADKVRRRLGWCAWCWGWCWG